MGRLVDHLRRHFLPEQVFQDIDSIDPGADFVDALQRGLDSCAAVLVVIGPGWLAAQDDEGRRRLDLADDWVRHEVAEALKVNDVRVIPVLLDGVQMPDAKHLPDSIRALSGRNAFHLTKRHWAKDVGELVGHLRRVPELGPSLGLTQKSPQVAAAQPVEQDLPEQPQSDPPPVPGGFNGKFVKGWRLPPKVLAGSIAVLALVGIFYIMLPDRPDVRKTTPSPVQTPAVLASQTLQAPVPDKALPAVSKAGELPRDCDQCPEIVVVPAGSFTMGSPNDEQGRSPHEGPQRRVAFARTFAVGKYEVTFDEWDACVAAGGCKHRPDDNGWGRGRRPVINVSWDDAQAYAAWLSKKTGKNYRLLSEAEWEYAARGGARTRYPWGDEPGNNQANFSGSGSRWSGKQTAPVGSFPPNAFGLHDMIGNAWEWTQDCWNESYQGAPVDGSAWQAGECGLRVARGGSGRGKPDHARVAFRNKFGPGSRGANLGFRLARTL